MGLVIVAINVGCAFSGSGYLRGRPRFFLGPVTSLALFFFSVKKGYQKVMDGSSNIDNPNTDVDVNNGNYDPIFKDYMYYAHIVPIHFYF